MKKILYPIFLFASSFAVAADPVVITEDTKLTLTQFGEYIMGAPFLTVTHNYNGARHYSGHFYLNGQMFTSLVIDANVSSGYFAFAGNRFVGEGVGNTISVSASDSATKVHIMSTSISGAEPGGGFAVDNCTVSMNLAADKQQIDGGIIRVRNNGALYWTGAALSGTRLQYVIGTEGSATDTSSRLILTTATKPYAKSILTVYNGSFSFTGHERMDFNNSIIHALSEDSVMDYFAVEANQTFVIGAGITNKITTNNNVTLFNNATLELNSTNVIMNGANNMGIWLANAANSVNIVLGADNNINNISGGAGIVHTVNIDLNGHALVTETLDFNIMNVNLTDFGNEMFRFKSENEESLILSHIRAWHDDIELTDLTIKEDGAYKYLFSESLVPEPAEWAAIFGLLALCFAGFSRRRQTSK